MRRSLQCGIFLALTLLAGCQITPYAVDDGGRTVLTEREFNVGSGDNVICPGELFAFASQNQAVCGSAPQACVSNSQGRSLRCQCSAREAGRPLWSCHE